jgi:OmpA-OmpF porin, OOP family
MNNTSGSHHPARSLTVGATACLAAVLLAGCASGPDPAVESARATLQAVQSDPVVVEHAPIALREAEQAFTRVEQAQAGDADGDEVQHLAYLAEQQAAIAQAVAVEQRNQQQIATLGQRMEEELRELRAQRTERGTVVTLSDVLFDVNRATINPGAQGDLLRLAEFLRENPNRRALIEGHTDGQGDAQYNLELSQSRADSVRSFLVMNGVSPDQIMARGYGETRPVASNDTDVGRQQNRRVEVVILDEGQPMPGVAGVPTG